MLGKNEDQNSSEIRWEEALRYFLIFKGAEGRSERTIQDYESHIRRFFQKVSGLFPVRTTSSASRSFISYGTLVQNRFLKN